MYIAKAFAQQPQFFAAVARAASALPHPVVVTPSLGTDWNGEPAVFFLIVLADGTPRGQLLNFTRQISQDIVRQVQPLEEWGVLPISTTARNRSTPESKSPCGHDPMPYADELLELAYDIANLHATEPRQSSLRRAVSTAYYALFHLLISEATANWNRQELRGALARVFDHGPMKLAADKKVAELNSYFKETPLTGRSEQFPITFTTLRTFSPRRRAGSAGRMSGPVPRGGPL